MPNEITSFIKANRQFGFSRSNGFMEAHTAIPFLHDRCYAALQYFAQNVNKLFLQDNLRPSPKILRFC